MRTAFINTLTELAEKDKRIMLLVGDLGFGVVMDFAKRFPDQFLNVGVAEQNMTGVATGLAMSGRIVFTYSIANFPILRCLEQIRNDVCYHEANVTAVSVGGGFCYGALGMTHHGTEDLAIMRSLPYMKVIAPADPIETKAATAYLAKGVGPAFLRLGRAGEPVVHEKPIEWELGKALTVKDGDDITIMATGGMVKSVLSAANRLQEDGISTRVISMHTLKPMDKSAIEKSARETKLIVTVEEHSLIGGLGSAVAEVLCELDVSVRFHRIGLPSEFTKHVGGQDYLRDVYGLSEPKLYQTILSLYREGP